MTKPQVFWAGAAFVLGSITLAHQLAGLPAAFLVAAAFVLTLVISLLWASLSALDQDRELSFDEAFHLAQPTAAEEQKRAVLRALNDLKYELSVGKISQEDFDSVSAHYRDEAKRLIALADVSISTGRERAERAIQERLAASGVFDLPVPPENAEADASSKEDEPSSAPPDESSADAITDHSTSDDSTDEMNDAAAPSKRGEA